MSKNIDPRFPPQQFKVSSYSSVIIINYLSTDDKESLWLYLKENHPNKAKSLQVSNNEPSKVVQRLFGKIIQGNLSMLMDDTNVSIILGQLGLGPKVYRNVTEGTISEYIEVIWWM